MTKKWEEISKLNLLQIISDILNLENKQLEEYHLNQLKGPTEFEIV